jgi:hypothetical protein
MASKNHEAIRSAHQGGTSLQRRGGPVHRGCERPDRGAGEKGPDRRTGEGGSVASTMSKPSTTATVKGFHRGPKPV